MRRLVSRTQSRGLSQSWWNGQTMCGDFMETMWLYWNGPGTWDQFSEPWRTNPGTLHEAFSRVNVQLSALTKEPGLKSLELRVLERRMRVWGLNRPHMCRIREWQLSFSLSSPGCGPVLRTIRTRGAGFPFARFSSWIRLLLNAPAQACVERLPGPIRFRGDHLLLYLEPAWEASMLSLGKLGKWIHFDSLGPLLNSQSLTMQSQATRFSAPASSNTESRVESSVQVSAASGPIQLIEDTVSQAETTLSQGENPEMAHLSQACESEQPLHPFPDAVSLRALLPGNAHFIPLQEGTIPKDPWQALYYQPDSRELLCSQVLSGEIHYRNYRLKKPLHRLLREVVFVGPMRELCLKDTCYQLPDALLMQD